MSTNPSRKPQPSPTPTAAISFGRVRFLAEPPPAPGVAATVLRHVTQPTAAPGAADTRTIVEWLALDDLPTPEAPPADAATFHFVFIPTDPRNTKEVQRRWAKWVESFPPRYPPSSIIKTRVSEGGIVLRADRVLLVAPAADREGLLAATADFLFYQRQLQKLEDEVAADWPLAQRDVPLMSDADRDSLRRGPELAELAGRATRRRMTYAALEGPLLRPDPLLPPAARTLYRRLAEAADMEDRLADVDGKVEVFEDIYEAVSQRVGEYRNFRKEFIVEVVIAVFLLFEIFLLIGEIYIIYYVSPT